MGSHHRLMIISHACLTILLMAGMLLHLAKGSHKCLSCSRYNAAHMICGHIVWRLKSYTTLRTFGLRRTAPYYVHYRDAGMTRTFASHQNSPPKDRTWQTMLIRLRRAPSPWTVNAPSKISTCIPFRILDPKSSASGCSAIGALCCWKRKLHPYIITDTGI